MSVSKVNPTQQFEKDVMQAASQLAHLHNLQVQIPQYLCDIEVPIRTNSEKPTSYDENQPDECAPVAHTFAGEFLNPAYLEAVHEESEWLVEHAVRLANTCPRALRRPNAESWQLPEMQTAGSLSVGPLHTGGHAKRFAEMREEVRRASH